jgi:hypothetical protein
LAWKLVQSAWRDRAQLDAYLRESWEPFAVTDADSEAIVWLRRSADPQDASVVDMPRRPRGEPEVAR